MIRLTTLCENTTDDVDLVAEYGWSVFIEAPDAVILFDTGQENAVCRNADALGVDLRTVNKIVLSHGHPDHTGGLRQVLRRIDHAVEIIAHPDIWAVRHKNRPNHETFSGIPYRREELESLGAVFNMTDQPVKLCSGVSTTGEIPVVTDFEDIASSLPVNTGWTIKKPPMEAAEDKIRDDQAVLIETSGGLAVVLGCGHRGIINTLYYAQKLTGIGRIDTVIGGAHLLFAGKERVQRTVEALRELNVRQLGLCHCTGLPVNALMVQEFGERFIFNNAGNVVELH